MEVTADMEVTEVVIEEVVEALVVDSSVIVTREVTDILMNLLISARDTIRANKSC